jgi:hypothetical protein
MPANSDSKGTARLKTARTTKVSLRLQGVTNPSSSTKGIIPGSYSPPPFLPAITLPFSKIQAQRAVLAAALLSERKSTFRGLKSPYERGKTAQLTRSASVCNSCVVYYVRNAYITSCVTSESTHASSVCTCSIHHAATEV